MNNKIKCMIAVLLTITMVLITPVQTFAVTNGNKSVSINYSEWLKCHDIDVLNGRPTTADKTVEVCMDVQSSSSEYDDITKEDVKALSLTVTGDNINVKNVKGTYEPNQGVPYVSFKVKLPRKLVWKEKIIFTISIYNSNYTITKKVAKHLDASDLDIAIKNQTYSGKAKRPTVNLTYKDKVIDKSTYSSTYFDNKKVGTARVFLYDNGEGLYAFEFEKEFKINPKGTSITSARDNGKDSITVKWKKQTTQTSGYQVRYSRNSKMKSAKTVTIKGNTNTSKKINNLKKNKKYYFQVRTYKTVDGEKYYSTWSSKKTETIVKPKTYKIIYKLNGGKNSKKNPKKYKSNNSLTLKQPKKKGYTFGGWYTDKKYKKEIKTIKEGNKKNITLYAKWDKVATYTIIPCRDDITSEVYDIIKYSLKKGTSSVIRKNGEYYKRFVRGEKIVDVKWLNMCPIERNKEFSVANRKLSKSVSDGETGWCYEIIQSSDNEKVSLHDGELIRTDWFLSKVYVHAFYASGEITANCIVKENLRLSFWDQCRAEMNGYKYPKNVHEYQKAFSSESLDEGWIEYTPVWKIDINSTTNHLQAYDLRGKGDSDVELNVSKLINVFFTVTDLAKGAKLTVETLYNLTNDSANIVKEKDRSFETDNGKKLLSYELDNGKHIYCKKASFKAPTSMSRKGDYFEVTTKLKDPKVTEVKITFTIKNVKRNSVGIYY